MQAFDTATFFDLQQQLDILEVAGAAQFNPFKFNYCAKLLKSTEQKSQQAFFNPTSSVAKLNAGIAQLQTTFNDGKQQAEKELQQLLKHKPEEYARLNQALEAGHFQLIHRAYTLHAQRDAFSQQTLQPLKDLSTALNQSSSQRAKQRSHDHLDSFLLEADNALIDAFEGQSSAIQQEPEPLTLQSIQLFKQSQQQFNTAKLVKQALADAPENPGPLNPHMLTIRSLTLMQELSPKYLERFVSYIDSVNWLEQQGDKILSKTKKNR